MSDAAAAAELVAKLITSPTQVGRFALLQDTDFVFNFGAGVGTGKGAGGSVTTANAANFPAVIGNGMAMAVGVMEPCGMNTPHTHPRATEFLFVINGTQLEVGFIEENGGRYVSNIMTPGQGTVFPKGSIHFQANLGCEPLTFVAGLNNIDPGVISVAQRYFGLPSDIVGASLGDIGLEEVVGIASAIPDNMALGIQTCLDTCNIQRGTQPTAQLQPRVSGNAFPSLSGASWSPSSSSYSSPSSSSYSKRSLVEETTSSEAPAKSPLSASIDDLIFMLQIVVGVMLSGYLVIGANYLLRRRSRAAIALPADQATQVIKN